MTEELIDTEPKPKRYKKRHVKYGITIAVNCNGHTHNVVYTPKGRLALVHHPKDELECDIALVALGAEEAPRCAALLKQWRITGDCTKHYFDIPIPIQGVRVDGEDVNLSDRLWAKYNKKAKYKNRDLLRATWPTTRLEAHDYIIREFCRNGLVLTKRLNGSIDLYDAHFGISQSNEITIMFEEDKRRFYIKASSHGLRMPRFYDQKSICMVPLFMGLSLFRSAYNDVHDKINTDHTYNRLQTDLMNRYRVHNNRFSISRGYYTDAINIDFQIPASKINTLAYLAKKNKSSNQRC